MTQQVRNDDGTPLTGEDTLTTADLAGGQSQTVDQQKGIIAPNRQPDEGAEPLFPSEDANELRSRWDTIQAGFVDEPRKAVEQADSLVALAMKRLAETFARERSQLEGQWDRGDAVSTEDLRVALRRYRSFFGRLLSM
ncbi:MAG: hypothetical protein ABI853_05885 [Sphingomicrobium sp.]